MILFESLVKKIAIKSKVFVQTVNSLNQASVG